MNSFRAYVIATVIGMILVSVYPSHAAIVGESDKDLIVEAEGQGETKLAALKAAWQEAVRIGIGMYLTSKSTLIDDALEEEIVTHSRGKVDSYQELSSTKGDSGWIVKIRAKIEKDILQETAVVSQNKSRTVVVDASNVAAKKITAEQKKLSAEELAKTYNPQYKITDFIDYDFSTKIDNGKLIIIHHLKLNMDTYNKFVNELEIILEQVAIKKEYGTFSADSMKAASEMKKKGSTQESVYKLNSNPYSDQILIAKSISDYIIYTLDSKICLEIIDKVKKFLRAPYISISFIIQALDADGDILTATKQGLSAHLPDATRIIAPYLYAEFFTTYVEYVIFINYKFNIPWKDISNEDLALMKTIKSRMQED
jgi:hypothetical protein